MPGSKISEFLVRDAANPANPNTLYGGLLSRVKKSKATRIRQFFWYQGEQESIENLPNYDKMFDQLYKNWQIDYPTVEEFVVFQINTSWTPVAGQIKDFQRRTKYIYPKTDHFSTFGVPLSPDGIHYLLNEYRLLGQQVFRFLAPKNYGSKDTIDVSCADIKKIFYTSSKKDQMILEFDAGQLLTWPLDTVMKGTDGSPVTMSLRNFFFLDGDYTKPASVKSGTVEGNRVTLTLYEPVKAKTLNYIPIYRPANISVFRGPFIRNTRGLAAFSFDNVSIYDALSLSSFTAVQSGSDIAVDAKWELSAGATSYLLERKADSDNAYTTVKKLDNKTTGYRDTDIKPNVTYSYRIRAVSATSESPTLAASVTISPILAVEPQNKNDFMRVFPNPVTDKINIQFKQPTSGLLQIVDKQGRNLFSDQIFSRKEYYINASLLPTGTYIISIKNNSGAVVSKKIIK